MRAKPLLKDIVMLSEEVSIALDERKPVVALESNVITHGIDYPQNVETAIRMCSAVKKSGAEPAIIYIDKGKIKVGASDEDIKKLAQSGDIPKASSRDLAGLLSSGKSGATTIASSMVVADLVGIDFFASAGLGGAHRGVEITMDISSDLIQLTRSRVTVVSAGAKSILDIGRTLEFLETHCVPVVGYKSDDFPAFYCRSSGFSVPQRVDSSLELSRMIELNRELHSVGSVLVTCPTREEDSIDEQEISAIIDRAVKAALDANIHGNGLTKFLMRAIDKETDGRSTEANISVLLNNAEVAGWLATAHAKYKRGEIPIC